MSDDLIFNKFYLITNYINTEIKYILISGLKYLKKRFTTSRIREKVFFLATVATISSNFIYFLMSVLTRHEPYSPYQLIQNDLHWGISESALLGFVLIETILNIDCALNLLFTVVSLYIAFFSMNFWLRKTW